MKLFATSVLLSGAVGASSASKLPFLKSKAAKLAIANPETRSLLDIRGGGVDPKFFTNAMTVAGITQGFVLLEAPEASIDMYRGKDKSPLSVYLIRITGAGILTIGVIAFCLFTMNQDSMKAIGWGSLVWTAEKASTLLNKVHDELGDNAKLDMFWSVINFLCIYVCFSGVDWGRNFLFGIFTLLSVNLAIGIISPRKNAEFYGNDPESITEEQLQIARASAYDNLAMAVFVLSLVKGVDPHKALGYTSVPIIASCAQTLLCDYALEQDVKIKLALWMLLHCGNFWTLGLGN